MKKSVSGWNKHVEYENYIYRPHVLLSTAHSDQGTDRIEYHFCAVVVLQNETGTGN